MSSNAASSLQLLSLDYDDIQNSLLDYLSSDPQFASYDFTTGGLAAIIKIMSYNAWQTAFFTNMAISESFLDTAQMQQSVFSHAKELGYVPRSTTSASANIVMSWTGPDPFYTIQKGQTFAALVRSLGSLIFTVPEDVLVISSNGVFSTNLVVYEGTYVADAYIMNYENPDQRFFITNPNVDTSSITVAVTENSSIGANVFTQATTLLGLNGTNRVWFLQAAETGQYEILFGDGVVGYLPSDGSKIVIDYRVSKGSAGNGAKSFNAAFNPSPGTAVGITVNTISASVGGANVESTDSVRFFAPRYFLVQERAVSANDYRVLLLEQFPEIEDCFAYGGEDTNPPQYGKVFVSVALANVDGLPEDRSQAYTAFLQQKCGLTTTPIIVEPAFQYLSITSTVTYDFTVTTLSGPNISAATTSAMQSFANTNLGSFNASFRYSRFLEAIDDADPSILSNQTNYTVYIEIPVIKGAPPTNFIPSYGYPLTSNPVGDNYNVRTAIFVLNSQQVFAADDGNGNMKLYYFQQGKIVPSTIIGNVNYATGVVTLTNFTVSDYNGPTLRIYATPEMSDVNAPQNVILNLGDEINITVIPTTSPN